MSSVYQDLAAELVRTRRIAETRGASQLINSTIEGGAVPIRDADGNLTGLVGEQYDGTFGAVTLGGPPPPIPSGLTVTTANSGVRVAWDGSFQDDDANSTDFAPTPIVAPQDFKRCSIEVADDLDFSNSRPGGDFISAGGGAVFVPWQAGEPVFVRLVCWSHAGKFSAPSAVVGPVLAGKIGVGDIGFDLGALGGTTIHYGDADPSADPDVTLAYGDLWLKVTDPDKPEQYLIQRWSIVSGADAWVELADQGVAAAAALAAAAQQTALANARWFTQPDEPAWAGAANSAVWIDSDNDNLMKAWDGVAFVPRPLGTGAFQPNSLVARDIIATGTIDATLLAALVVLADQAVVVGDPNGAHTRLDGPSASLVAYVAGSGATPLPEEVARFGATSGGRDPASGRVTWSIDQQGHASLTSASVEDDMTIRGESVLALMNDRAGNVVDRYTDTLGSDLGAIGSNEVGIVEINGWLEAGRIYELSHRLVYFLSLNGSADSEAVFRNIWTGPSAAGSTAVAPAPMVTDSNPKAVTAWYQRIPTAFTRRSQTGVTMFEPQFSGHYRFLLTARRGAGTGDGIYIVGDRDIEFWLKDAGPRPPGSGGTLSRGGGTLVGAAPPPPPAAPKVTRTETWLATWSRSWRQNGAISFNGPMYQGYGDSFNGVQSSSVGFADLTGVLSGATIQKVEIFLHAEHWYSFAGGTAGIGHHNSLGLPGAFPGVGGYFTVPGWKRNEGRWIDVTAWGAGLKSGAIRGISLTPPGGSASSEFYGRFSGHQGYRWPSIRIKYTK